MLATAHALMWVMYSALLLALLQLMLCCSVQTVEHLVLLTTAQMHERSCVSCAKVYWQAANPCVHDELYSNNFSFYHVTVLKLCCNAASQLKCLHCCS
jgi:hypothetical protein